MPQNKHLSDDASRAPKIGGFLKWAGVALLAYLLVAYVIVPRFWEIKSHRDPVSVTEDLLTHTGTGLAGDPVNIALTGTEEQVVRAMLAAGWKPADALTFESSVRISVDSVIDRPDVNAPVSNLYLFGRREDLAYEKPIGHSPRKRNHVRFWKSAQQDAERPVWMGAATMDERVELSHTTGQVTHRISPDLDAERDLLLADITRALPGAGVRWVDGFHKETKGRNGGGDPWFTDGRLCHVALPDSPAPAEGPAPHGK